MNKYFMKVMGAIYGGVKEFFLFPFSIPVFAIVLFLFRAGFGFALEDRIDPIIYSTVSLVLSFVTMGLIIRFAPRTKIYQKIISL